MNFDELRENFSNNCKTERKRLKLNQDEFAKKLHMEQSSISKWEKQKVIPDVYVLLQVAELFNCSIDTLIGRNYFDEEKKQPAQIELAVEKDLSEGQKECLELIKKLNDKQLKYTKIYLQTLLEEEVEEKTRKIKKD